MWAATFCWVTAGAYRETGTNVVGTKKQMATLLARFKSPVPHVPRLSPVFFSPFYYSRLLFIIRSRGSTSLARAYPVLAVHLAQPTPIVSHSQHISQCSASHMCSRAACLQPLVVLPACKPHLKLRSEINRRIVSDAHDTGTSRVL